MSSFDAPEIPPVPARILAAAVDHFARAGFEGARVDSIAQSAGVNKALLYYHVGDKTVLYERVVGEVLARMTDQIADRVLAASGPEQKLRILIRTLAENLATHPRIVPVLLRELASGGRRLPDEILTTLARLVNGIHTILVEGRTAGVFRTANPMLIHMVILGSLLYLGISEPVRSKTLSSRSTMLRRDVDPPPAEAARQLEDLVIEALLDRG